MPVRLLPFVVLGLLPATVAAQGLGGVARSEAERREHKTPTRAQTHTYTNSDLRVEEEWDADDSVADDDRAAETEPAAQPTSATGPADTSQSADLARLRAQLDRASARRKEREQKWRRRAAGLRSKVAAAQKAHDVACDPSSISLRGG